MGPPTKPTFLNVRISQHEPAFPVSAQHPEVTCVEQRRGAKRSLCRSSVYSKSSFYTCSGHQLLETLPGTISTWQMLSSHRTLCTSFLMKAVQTHLDQFWSKTLDHWMLSLSWKRNAEHTKVHIALLSKLSPIQRVVL
jgi:hypothetical protein